MEEVRIHEKKPRSGMHPPDPPPEFAPASEFIALLAHF